MVEIIYGRDTMVEILDGSGWIECSFAPCIEREQGPQQGQSFFSRI